MLQLSTSRPDQSAEAEFYQVGQAAGAAYWGKVHWGWSSLRCLWRRGASQAQPAG